MSFLNKNAKRVSFIIELVFKNIVGLCYLNFRQINEEICMNIHESTVEALTDLVNAFSSICGDFVATLCPICIFFMSIIFKLAWHTQRVKPNPGVKVV